jgi:hypothetical protein
LRVLVGFHDKENNFSFLSQEMDQVDQSEGEPTLRGSKKMSQRRMSQRRKLPKGNDNKDATTRQAMTRKAS